MNELFLGSGLRKKKKKIKVKIKAPFGRSRHDTWFIDGIAGSVVGGRGRDK